MTKRQVMYGVEGPKMFARFDSKTGKGMNEGYVVHDGLEYFAEESDLVEYLRSLISDGGEGLTDEFILNDAYDNNEYYYTDWDVAGEAVYYVEQPDGTLKEIQK
jgi:hypothetical protein